MQISMHFFSAHDIQSDWLIYKELIDRTDYTALKLDKTISSPQMKHVTVGDNKVYYRECE